ncbi:hypothetical protein KIH27_20070 [Mycobacterium sp. M1]|uniref:Uncharacterized protein n=1 Tax=Mycolicibacter acidiphilus TaxID=2835306 RepID=A0ABS5RNJ9_9MYCO|nr:hypothetical protein [Mycolicibacter acidiphilus]MBS9535885.1 hypothetical protein [Mycolicibacter acidiphilus]
MAEVTADARARISLGHTGVHRDDRFLVSRSARGEILLTPMASVPRRELLIWADDVLRASLLRGLADTAAGRVSPRDDLLDS